MSDVAVRSNAGVPRAELRAAFGNNPRLIKAFEDLLQAVGVTLPDTIVSTAQDVSAVLTQASFLAPAQQRTAPTAPEVGQALAQASFARPQPPAQPVNDAAGQFLAGQIFGA